MGKISEKTFERRDHKYTDYSSIEYDLYAKLGLTLVKNHKLNRYELIKIRDRSIIHFNESLSEIVKKCNELEGAENTYIE